MAYVSKATIGFACGHSQELPVDPGTDITSLIHEATKQHVTGCAKCAKALRVDEERKVKVLPRDLLKPSAPKKGTKKEKKEGASA